MNDLNPTSNRERRTRVFLSYSRVDSDFAAQLTKALEHHGIECFIDVSDILPAEEWRPRLDKLIQQADVVVFLLSDDSIRSEVCTWEITRAAELGKRIVPAVIRALPSAALPDEIGKRNFVFFTADVDAGLALRKLVQAIQTDIAWIREHTRLGDLAQQWLDRNKPVDRLLRGPDIQAAEDWLRSRAPDAPEPTASQLALIAASRDNWKRNQRRLKVAATTGSVLLAVAAALGVWNFTMRGEIVTAGRELKSIKSERRRLEDVIKTTSVLMPRHEDNIAFIKGKLGTGIEEAVLAHAPKVELSKLQLLAALLAASELYPGNLIARMIDAKSLVSYKSGNNLLQLLFDPNPSLRHARELTKGLIDQLQISEDKRTLYKKAVDILTEEELMKLYHEMAGFTREFDQLRFYDRAEQVRQAIEVYDEGTLESGIAKLLEIAGKDRGKANRLALYLSMAGPEWMQAIKKHSTGAAMLANRIYLAGMLESNEIAGELRKAALQLIDIAPDNWSNRKLPLRERLAAAHWHAISPDQNFAVETGDDCLLVLLIADDKNACFHAFRSAVAPALSRQIIKMERLPKKDGTTTDDAKARTEIDAAETMYLQLESDPLFSAVRGQRSELTPEQLAKFVGIARKTLELETSLTIVPGKPEKYFIAPHDAATAQYAERRRASLYRWAARELLRKPDQAAAALDAARISYQLDPGAPANAAVLLVASGVNGSRDQIARIIEAFRKTPGGLDELSTAWNADLAKLGLDPGTVPLIKETSSLLSAR